MALTDGDRSWLETKFLAVHDKIDQTGSKVHRLDTEVELLKAHKCEAALEAHEKGSIVHNPKKAIGLGASILGLIEGIRAFLHR